MYWTEFKKHDRSFAEKILFRDAVSVFFVNLEGTASDDLFNTPQSAATTEIVLSGIWEFAPNERFVYLYGGTAETANAYFETTGDNSYIVKSGDAIFCFNDVYYKVLDIISSETTDTIIVRLTKKGDSL